MNEQNDGAEINGPAPGTPKPGGNAKAPRVVAELGRPETPEETAARKAQNSRNHRTRQTVNNLVFSLLATVGLVVVIVLIVPRSDPGIVRNIDYASIATAAANIEPDPLVAPVLPKSWTSNHAELHTKTADGIDSWTIGLVTPDTQYIEITQGFNTNPSWLADQLAKTSASGAVTLDGINWTVYNNRESTRDVGNVRYALVTEAGSSTYILFGTAGDKDFETVARALAKQITATP